MAIFSSESHADGLIISRTYSFARLRRYLHTLLLFLCRLSAFHITPFFLQLCYLINFISLTFLSLIGSLLLALLKPSDPAFSPGYLDMLFMSTSAITVSTASASSRWRDSPVHRSSFSCFLCSSIGGDVFVSLLVLLLNWKSQDDGELIEER